MKGEGEVGDRGECVEGKEKKGLEEKMTQRMFARHGKSLLARTQTRGWLLSTKPFHLLSTNYIHFILYLPLQPISVATSEPRSISTFSASKPRADQVENRFIVFQPHNLPFLFSNTFNLPIPTPTIKSLCFHHARGNPPPPHPHQIYLPGILPPRPQSIPQYQNNSRLTPTPRRNPPNNPRQETPRNTALGPPHPPNSHQPHPQE